MGLLEWLTQKQPKRGYLLGALAAAQRLLETKLSLNSRFNSAIRERIPQEHGKAPQWASELYLLCTLVFAVLSFAVAQPVDRLQLVLLLTVAWPIYRIAEVLTFLIGWVFVHEAGLHSVQRSLFAFILNIFELSLLFGALRIGIAGLSETRLDLFLTGVVDISTIASPEITGYSVGDLLEIVRLFASLLLVLVVVGSLTGDVVRRTVEPGAGK